MSLLVELLSSVVGRLLHRLGLAGHRESLDHARVLTLLAFVWACRSDEGLSVRLPLGPPRFDDSLSIVLCVTGLLRDLPSLVLRHRQVDCLCNLGLPVLRDWYLLLANQGLGRLEDFYGQANDLTFAEFIPGVVLDEDLQGEVHLEQLAADGSGACLA